MPDASERVGLAEQADALVANGADEAAIGTGDSETLAG